MYYIAKVEGCRIWDNVDQIDSILHDLKNHRDQIKGIELSSNSIGYEVAKALAEVIRQLPNLEIVNYRDIFVGRKKEDLPKSLFELISAIQDKNIRVLDLSDNAFGPIGVASFDFFLRKNTSLKEIHLENNGLGPEGAEQVANTLLENENLKLEIIKVNRNRLENKGAIAFSKLFTKMQSFHHIQIFQNGIKEEGMSELLKSFAHNPNLEILKLNDNLVKNSAEILLDTLNNLLKLKIIDISDSLLGNENSLKLFKSFSNIPSLREIYFNYNEIEKKSTQKAIFEICLGMENIEIVEIKGNEIDQNLWKKFKKDLRLKIKRFTPYSDEEEVLSEEEDELVEQIGKLNLDK